MCTKLKKLVSAVGFGDNEIDTLSHTLPLTIKSLRVENGPGVKPLYRQANGYVDQWYDDLAGFPNLESLQLHSAHELVTYPHYDGLHWLAVERHISIVWEGR
jgi:hypothetical protein